MLTRRDILCQCVGGAGAEAKGELTIKDSGAVVDIPLLTWPGGHR